jgi:hypothetical protein
MPLGRICARPSCIVHAAHTHTAGLACVHSVRGPRLAGPAWACAARDSAARERTPERSPLSGRASWRGRWQRYRYGGGANDGARAPTTERLSAGHGGGEDSSPEFLVDGEGEKNRLGGGIFRRGEGSGGRRRSYDWEEGED